MTYLKHILHYVEGKTIDFGCGTGELLSLLPNGSIGVDINKASYEYCKKNGMNVRLYDPVSDDYQFIGYEIGTYKTFVMNHVLEHIENPQEVIKKILKSCYRIGVEKIIIVIPGLKGFKHDKTHKIFIDFHFFEKYGLTDAFGYAITKHRYFPFNLSWVGNYFTYNELLIMYNKKNNQYYSS